MKVGPGILAGACIFLSPVNRPAAAADDSPSISLTVPSGTPLRLYLTKKVSKRADSPVEAKVIEPVYAFDREVIPAGSMVTGKVSRTQPVQKWQRFQAIVNGDFTPLRNAHVEFDSLTLPYGRTLLL